MRAGIVGLAFSTAFAIAAESGGARFQEIVHAAIDAGTLGTETLSLRMERHCDNAEVVVEFLRSHPGVTSVHYPGLVDHPNHDVAARQMARFGGMVAFRVRGGEDVATKVCAETELWTLAESLGGIESLIEHPHLMTHASVAGTELEVPGDLIRLSVGIEDAEDLVADLRQALDRLT